MPLSSQQGESLPNGARRLQGLRAALDHAFVERPLLGDSCVRLAPHDARARLQGTSHRARPHAQDAALAHERVRQLGLGRSTTRVRTRTPSPNRPLAVG
jgi:hypothetical protein